MTPLEVHNRIRDHLLQQGGRSVEADSDSCMYRTRSRTGEVLKCALGCLIKNKHYRKGLEGQGATDADVLNALEKSGVDVDSNQIGSLLRVWQNAHDSHMRDEHRLYLITGVDTQLPWDKYIKACAARIEEHHERYHGGLK